MKISLNWVNDYVDAGMDAPHIAQILMDRGFPCESIEQVGDDWVIDVEVTSNRGDCLGHIGIARELACAAGRPLRLPQVEYPESQTEASQKVSVEIAEPDLCGRYTARIIDGVRVGPSPDWMVRRLDAVGMRSVSNVVDATNYAMLECGQPPHAFDYTKIAEGRIIVPPGPARRDDREHRRHAVLAQSRDARDHGSQGARGRGRSDGWSGH